MKNKIDHRKEIADLYRRIHLAEKTKIKVVEYLALYNELYSKRKISNEEYSKKINQNIKGKRAEEWIGYYDNYVTECKQEISKYSTKINTSKKLEKTIGFVKNPYFIIFAITLSLLGFFAFNLLLETKITGFAIFEDIIQGDFENGTFEQTNSSAISGIVILDNSSTSAYYLEGNFTSQIFNVNYSTSWNNISWTQGAPYRQGLASNEEDEIVSGILGGVNMTDNVILLHFDNDSNFGENDTLGVDFSGRGNNATGFGFDFDEVNTTDCKFNNCFTFDGTNDYMESTHSQTGVTAYTIAVWIKTTSASTSLIIDARGSPENSLSFGLLSGGEVWYIVNAASTDLGRNSVNTVNDGQWHHIVGTWSAPSGTSVLEQATSSPSNLPQI